MPSDGGPFQDRLFHEVVAYGRARPKAIQSVARLVVRDLNPRTGKPDLERVFPQVDGSYNFV